MQHELEVNAWVWSAPRTPDEIDRLVSAAEDMGASGGFVDTDHGDAYIVRIVAVETMTGVSATRAPLTTVTVLDAADTSSTFSENIASALARATARTGSDPLTPSTTDIQIDSAQFVVRAATPSSAVDVALGHFSRDHDSAGDLEWRSELLAVSVTPAAPC
jgi:hypothetical protein